MRENHFQEQAHQEIDQIFRSLFPKYGMTIREEQLRLCHQMLSALWNGQIALCDAAVGVGKTYAYLTASLLFRKYSGVLKQPIRAVLRKLKGKVSVPILRVWKDSQRVIREFKEHKNAVLFAAGSCWEGMDFPGDMVSSLIIVRLPFPVPDPVREAERERYQSLQEYIRQIVVPDMQLKLRQGFGRAIRTENDTCVVSILDSRAARGGRYHEAVLEALPRCRMTEDIGDVERFIRERKGIDYYM